MAVQIVQLKNDDTTGLYVFLHVLLSVSHVLQLPLTKFTTIEWKILCVLVCVCLSVCLSISHFFQPGLDLGT